MFKKKICLSVLLLSTLTMSIPVYAQEQTPEVTQTVQPTEPQSEQQIDAAEEQLNPQVSLIQYSNVNSDFASLSISSSGSVSAAAYIAGYTSTTTQIIGYLNLEHLIGGSWVTETSWYESTPTAYLYMSKSTNVYAHGTYRLRLVGIVTSKTSTEQITTYSNQFTY